jgi:predicted TIM-barrel fold metal-dependent hydrolase
MLPIIDTHQHLWDLSRFTLHWTAGAPALARSFLQSDYAEAVQGLNVVKAIYMEVDVDELQQMAEAEYIIEQCQRPDTLTVAVVISGRPAADGFRSYITAYKGSPYIKGVRQVLHGAGTPPGFCLQPTFVKNMQLLGELGMSFDLCMRSGELSDAAKLAAQCPHTLFILDHCGNGDPYRIADVTQPATTQQEYPVHTRQQWLADIQRLAEYPNVVCKISGIIASVRPGWTPAILAPTVNHCLDSFGPDRVVFGGDWPVCTLGASYAEWAAALRSIIAGRSQEEQAKLLYTNAERIYRLNS